MEILIELGETTALGNDVQFIMFVRYRGRLFHLKIHWLMRKGSGDSCPRSATGALLKEQNHNFAERFNDSKLIAKYY